jgi:BASS family bile acid:Na+ symporter
MENTGLAEFLRNIVGFLVPVFVVSTMANVGITQRPSQIATYLRHWRFILRMLIANFVLVPLFMVLVLRLTSFDFPLEAGLLIFALCAGAPFLIKLTAAAGHDLALGAAVMMLLMVLTLGYVPLVLPKLLPGSSTGAWAIARPLLRQMIAPLVLGMLAAQFLPAAAAVLQPWVGRLANVALYAVIAATLIGYSHSMLAIGPGAIAVALLTIAAAFGFGYLAGGGRHHLQDVGGLGTAQRNTAAGLIIATKDFDDPRVLVMITVANTLGIVLLLLVARLLRLNNAPAAQPAPAGRADDQHARDTQRPIRGG